MHRLQKSLLPQCKTTAARSFSVRTHLVKVPYSSIALSIISMICLIKSLATYNTRFKNFTVLMVVVPKTKVSSLISRIPPRLTLPKQGKVLKITHYRGTALMKQNMSV
ncbi:Uncharacterised protein [Vibrio cholerae]|nr:Uncharacterised protein [Vibrio cholerae]